MVMRYGRRVDDNREESRSPEVSDENHNIYRNENKRSLVEMTREQYACRKDAMGMEQNGRGSEIVLPSASDCWRNEKESSDRMEERKKRERN